MGSAMQGKVLQAVVPPSRDWHIHYTRIAFTRLVDWSFKRKIQVTRVENVKNVFHSESKTMNKLVFNFAYLFLSQIHIEVLRGAFT